MGQRLTDTVSARTSNNSNQLSCNLTLSSRGSEFERRDER
jgi:hypothetical protein